MCVSDRSGCTLHCVCNHKWTCTWSWEQQLKQMQTGSSWGWPCETNHSECIPWSVTAHGCSVHAYKWSWCSNCQTRFQNLFCALPGYQQGRYILCITLHVVVNYILKCDCRAWCSHCQVDIITKSGRNLSSHFNDLPLSHTIIQVMQQRSNQETLREWYYWQLVLRLSLKGVTSPFSTMKMHVLLYATNLRRVP